MGLYTEVIRERDRRDRQTEQEAERRMMNRLRTPYDTNGSEGAQLVVNMILGRFGLSAEMVHGYSDTFDMLDQMLDPLNVLYDAVDTAETDWMNRTEYMLGFFKDGRAVLLKPAVRGYRFFCPETGEKGSIKGGELQDTAFAIQRPLSTRSSTLLSLAIYMMRLISVRDLVLIGGATLAISLLGLVTPKMNQYVLNDIVPLGTDGYGLLMRSLALFLITGIIRASVSVCKNIFMGGMRVRISSEAQAAVMSKTLLLPQSFFTSASTGKLSKQISNMRSLCDQILSFVMGASLTAVFSLVYIPQMAAFSPVLLVPAIAVLLMRSGYTVLAGTFMLENEKNKQIAEMEERSFLYTALKGVQRIKESGAERRVYARWMQKYQALLASDLDQPVIMRLEDTAMSFFSSLATVLLLALIVPASINKADYIAFNSAFALISSAVGDLLSAQRSLTMMKPKLAQLKGFMEAMPEDGENRAVVRKLKGDIRVENISFAYEDNRFGCLEDVSLHIAAGEKVAIVGESGCGKSTLLRIILGMLRPDTGCVYFDGAPIDTINLRSLRRRIGTVFQFSRVMPGTVYSNIAFGPRPVSIEEAREAAEKADIADTIEQLPLGYDTEISDSNSGGFSGGQRQRLLLARAFAAKPDIMILDEATSALDNISQAKVLRSVYEEDCTVIMVAHRLSTVKECDRIILLGDGHILEQGTYDELMEMKGGFYELMRRQSA